MHLVEGVGLCRNSTGLRIHILVSTITFQMTDFSITKIVRNVPLLIVNELTTQCHGPTKSRHQGKAHQEILLAYMRQRTKLRRVN